jgi:hypothetical protein
MFHYAGIFVYAKGNSCKQSSQEVINAFSTIKNRANRMLKKDNKKRWFQGF